MSCLKVILHVYSLVRNIWVLVFYDLDNHGIVSQNPITSDEDNNFENSKLDLNSRTTPAGFGRESAGSSVLAVSIMSLSKHFYFNIHHTIDCDFCTDGRNG